MKLVYASTVHKTNIGQPKILHELTQQCWNYTNLDRGFSGYEISLTLPL